MISRFDELFSPEKLRENWQPLSVSVPTPAAVHSSIYHHFLVLQTLIAEQFLDISPLAQKLEEINKIIDLSFDGDVAKVDSEQKAVLIGLLEELEELIRGAELAQQRRL